MRPTKNFTSRILSRDRDVIHYLDLFKSIYAITNAVRQSASAMARRKPCIFTARPVQTEYSQRCKLQSPIWIEGWRVWCYVYNPARTRRKSRGRRIILSHREWTRPNCLSIHVKLETDVVRMVATLLRGDGMWSAISPRAAPKHHAGGETARDKARAEDRILCNPRWFCPGPRICIP